MMEVDYVLGIDLGTTSVKISVIEKLTKKIKFTSRQESLADEITFHSDWDEQNIVRIFTALEESLERVPKATLQRVSQIAVCGQMHGVVLWQKNAFNIIDNNIGLREEGLVSKLITWRDSRCSQSILSSFPSTDTGIPLCTGFGCASLFWLKKNTPEMLVSHDCAGTVQDLLVSILCGLENSLMSSQNAASWGYFDFVKGVWEIERLKNADFPIHLLPQVKSPGTIAGYLQTSWHCIPQGTKVHVALGDFQCSVKASIKEQTDVVINISTSAQIAVILPTVISKPSETVQILPYFGQQVVATSASLTGGNSLDAFIKMLQEWMTELGLDMPEKGNLYARISAISTSAQDSTLCVIPTLWGERHEPCKKATVDNITVDNVKSLGTIWNSICRGIIENLSKMMPNEFIAQVGARRIIGTGSALLQNPALQTYIKELINLPLHFEQDSDASTGAAQSVMDNY